MRVPIAFVALLASVVLPSVAAAQTSYERVVTKLRSVNAANPAITHLVSLGPNDQGTELLGLVIDPPARGPRFAPPDFLVVGAHHGNERLSVDVALRFLDDTVAAAARGEPIGGRFHVFPVLNVTGYNASRREETRSGTTLDPNRDYPDPCRDDGAYHLKSTKALSTYVETASIVAAVTIHGYIGTFTYPWGTYTTEPQTLDHSHFHDVTTVAARANGYDVGTHGEVIYPTVGAFEDWAYFEKGVWVTLLEIANNPNVARDAQAIKAFFDHVPRERSTQHEHTGRCRAIEGPVLSRP